MDFSFHSRFESITQTMRNMQYPPFGIGIFLWILYCFRCTPVFRLVNIWSFQRHLRGTRYITGYLENLFSRSMMYMYKISSTEEILWIASHISGSSWVSLDHFLFNNNNTNIFCALWRFFFLEFLIFSFFLRLPLFTDTCQIEFKTIQQLKANECSTVQMCSPQA